MRVSIYQRLVIFESLSLLGALDPTSTIRDGAPESDIAIIGTGKDVLIIRGEFRGEDSVDR